MRSCGPQLECERAWASVCCVVVRSTALPTNSPFPRFSLTYTLYNTPKRRSVGQAIASTFLYLAQYMYIYISIASSVSVTVHSPTPYTVNCTEGLISACGWKEGRFSHPDVSQSVVMPLMLLISALSYTRNTVVGLVQYCEYQGGCRS